MQEEEDGGGDPREGEARSPGRSVRPTGGDSRAPGSSGARRSHKASNAPSRRATARYTAMIPMGTTVSAAAIGMLPAVP